tara:strand:- start:77 stop:724 length:648 start_codon:yes stop_codon:yes gene_type:complete
MQYRYELKFPIRKDKLYLVSTWLEKQKFIKKQFPNRKVNSCYYDTMYYKNANDNIAGISRRLKHRSRSYNDSDNYTFEIKVKNGNLGSKLSCKLNNYSFYNNILSSNNFLSNPYYYLHNLKNLKLFPIIQIEYLRSYYLINNIRITLDDDIKYKNKSVNYKTNLFIHDNMSLLEIKFDKIYLKEAQNFFKNFPFRAKRNSKYLRGLSQLKIASYI